MTRVKEGDFITIENVVYRFGPNSTMAFNSLADCFDEAEGDVITKKKLAEKDIHLYSADGKTGKSIKFAVLKKALEDRW